MLVLVYVLTDPAAPIGGTLGDLDPKIESLKITETTKSSVSILAKLNFTNPTRYSAYIPFIDFLLAYNDTVVGHVTGRDISVLPGNNTGVEVYGQWNPEDASGKKGIDAGREMLSEYVSGRFMAVEIH